MMYEEWLGKKFCVRKILNVSCTNLARISTGMAAHPNFRSSRYARTLAVVQVDGPKSFLSLVKSFNRIREFVTAWLV